MFISKSKINGLEVLIVQNNLIRIKIVPALGGKMISVFNKEMNKEFLWSNRDITLQLHEPGVDYDTNFYGGIDELIPNDLAEVIDGVSYPDHGELWTTSLQYEASNEGIRVYGKLSLCELFYEKFIRLDKNLPIVHLNYKIVNESESRKNFLWKLHAALAIEAGDKLITDALGARIVDPEYSRFTYTEEFNWPIIEDIDASIVPAPDNTMDFFYLYDIHRGEMRLKNFSDNSLFAYIYDKNVFPYQWYFASYGRFFDHYTSILEPCSCMPMSVNKAKDMGQCTMLDPSEEVSTTVSIYAGKEKYYINNE